MNSHDYARGVADSTVGASLSEIQARFDAAQYDLFSWIAAYEAACAQYGEHGSDPLLTVKQVATLLGCSNRHVYSLMETGTLPVVGGLGAMRRVRRSDVAQLINSTAEPPYPDQTLAGERRPRILEFAAGYPNRELTERGSV